jgi:hypothetical protein
MPTEPLESILYRDLTIAQARPVIDVAVPLLEELVNFGTHALVRCATSAQGGEDEDVAAMSLYRHIIEMTDGVAVLLSHSCAYASIPLVRSAFEALISIDYIIESDATYVTRSLSWLAGYMHQRIQMYELLDPATTRGQGFQHAMSTDDYVQSIPLPEKADIDAAIANLRGLLAMPQFSAIDNDLNALQGRRHWYRLYGGPNDLRELAHCVGKSALYDFMYRYWSRVSHAEDFGAFLAKAADGQGTIGPIRDPNEMKNSANFAATVFLSATIAMIRKFRPGEDIRRWYEREVRPRYVRIFRTS